MNKQMQQFCVIDSKETNNKARNKSTCFNKNWKSFLENAHTKMFRFTDDFVHQQVFRTLGTDTHQAV